MHVIMRLNSLSTWMATRRAARRARDAEKVDDEESTKRRNGLDMFAATVRLWLWLLSLHICASFAFFAHNHDRHGNRQGRVIGALNFVAFTYHTAILVSACIKLRKRFRSAAWRFFSVATITGDLFFIGLAIALMTALAMAGALAPCHEGPRASFIANHDMLRRHFGGPRHHRGFFNTDNMDGPDPECVLPKTIYLSCVVAIFSYILSVVLTVLQLQRYKKPQEDYVEEAMLEASGSSAHLHHQCVEAIMAMQNEQNQRLSHEELGQVAVYQLGRSSFSSDRSLSIKGRCSQETTTSSVVRYDSLVTDGFRPTGEPPAYSSRPSSLHKEST
ncbi:hypothetical protein B0T17DRAFT_505607 [Bombardia bombarda]|uniref:Uncharacterized protein n=1 Tax=Bombardia bombarda TaxID=252184 RepID=A0AA40C8D9_9PEZI|nr:hypothetical protein B0T17DRAFT_505607 [Bombardia bombarda]